MWTDSMAIRLQDQNDQSIEVFTGTREEVAE